MNCFGTGRSRPGVLCEECHGSGSRPTPLAEQEERFPIGRAVFMAVLVVVVILLFMKLHG